MTRLDHALVVGKEDGRKVIALRERSLKHPVSIQEVRARRTLHRIMVELNPLGISQIGETTAIDLPVGYRLNYAVEEVAPSVHVRHLTVSGPLDVPHPEAVAFLMWMMQFRHSIDDCLVYTEPVEPTVHATDRVAVNVVEPVHGSVDRMLEKLIDEVDQGFAPNAPTTTRTQ